MPLTTAGKNLALAALPLAYASLHTGNPSESGANEVSGGGYARGAITFAAPSAGTRNATSSPVISVPAGTTITYVGYWSAATGGTFLGYDDVTSAVFTNAGTYTVNTSQFNLS